MTQCDNSDLVSLRVEEVESNTHTRKRRRDTTTDQERPSGKRRNRTNFTTEQVHYLELYFAEEPYPDGMQRKSISSHLHLSEQTVTFWFQNRRARARRMAGNPTMLIGEAKKRKEVPLQPATNWYFPLNSSNISSTPLPRKRNPPQPKTSSPIGVSPYPNYYQCPAPGPLYPPTHRQTTPPPYPYYPSQYHNPFYPPWIQPVADDQIAAHAVQLSYPVSLPSVIEITPPPSVSGAGNITIINGSADTSHSIPPPDSPLSVSNLIGRKGTSL